MKRDEKKAEKRGVQKENYSDVGLLGLSDEE